MFVTRAVSFAWQTMTWFVLIALSPVLTYQHHVIDIVGGFVLAGYCFYFFRESSHAPPVVANRRIGSYYAAGAAVVLIMGAIFWPWGVLLLWPAIALGIVAIAYFRAGPIVFHKTEGKLPWSTRFVLAPCLLGRYSVVAVLPEPMSIVGQSHTTNLDWRQTGAPFCEQSFALRGCLRA